jgi:hypothetical protein
MSRDIANGNLSFGCDKDTNIFNKYAPLICGHCGLIFTEETSTYKCSPILEKYRMPCLTPYKKKVGGS